MTHTEEARARAEEWVRDYYPDASGEEREALLRAAEADFAAIFAYAATLEGARSKGRAAVQRQQAEQAAREGYPTFEAFVEKRGRL